MHGQHQGRTLVFCYQNCSNLLWEKTVLVIKKTWPGMCKNFEITRKIYSNSERAGQFLVTKWFLTWFWRFLISNNWEELEFKLKKKVLGFRNMREKLENTFTHFLKSQKVFSRILFLKILALCMVSIQERFLIKSRLWWCAYGIRLAVLLFSPKVWSC